MYLRRSTTVKYMIATFFGAVIYCEWYVYLIQKQYWPELECDDQDTSCIKILFIADPQIQGDEAVPPPLSYLFNWDSDSYLRSTFKVVVDYWSPEILVYLGDLMDEGSIATMPQFHGYVKRLAGIFEWDFPAVRVWVPGDNDIGGENEPIRRDKIEEFEKVFEQPPIVEYSNISFYKVNAITYKFPRKDDEFPGNEKNFKIAVSHYSVTDKSMFAHQFSHSLILKVRGGGGHIFPLWKRLTFKRLILTKRNLNVFFKDLSIDTHHGYAVGVAEWTDTTLNISFEQETLYEVYVPTCSYRMGTDYIGYGAAVLENNQKNMRYTVFWSPTRFPYLIIYLCMLVILLLYCLVFCVARLCHRKSATITKSADMSPLLQRI
ncbi:hypothetical protein SFRURICE_010917 [Spodoptera frugiperda]|nr:hypothetical protein SFRURICE_010917 [Spodoptera frugiperda]